MNRIKLANKNRSGSITHASYWRRYIRKFSFTLFLLCLVVVENIHKCSSLLHSAYEDSDRSG